MENEYGKPVADGFYTAKPAWIGTGEDHFNEGSTVVEMSFDMGDGFEHPRAKMTLVMSTAHVVKARDQRTGAVSERKATPKDQQDAIALLGRVFPAWAEFCRSDASVAEKLNWFNDHSEEAKEQDIRIRVKHNDKGFPNAYVNDPANQKRRTVTAKSSAMSRAAAAIDSIFGGSATKQQAPAEDAFDDNAPF